MGWGGSTKIPLPFFTVFNMGDPPEINVSKVLKCKINHNFFSLKNMTFPNKNSHIFPFFSANVPKGNVSGELMDPSTPV